MIIKITPRLTVLTITDPDGFPPVEVAIEHPFDQPPYVLSVSTYQFGIQRVKNDMAAQVFAQLALESKHNV